MTVYLEPPRQTKTRLKNKILNFLKSNIHLSTRFFKRINPFSTKNKTYILMNLQAISEYCQESINYVGYVLSELIREGKVFSTMIKGEVMYGIIHEVRT